MRRFFPCGNNSAMRKGWLENIAGRQHRRHDHHAAADNVPVL